MADPGFINRFCEAYPFRDGGEQKSSGIGARAGDGDVAEALPGEIILDFIKPIESSVARELIANVFETMPAALPIQVENATEDEGPDRFQSLQFNADPDADPIGYAAAAFELCHLLQVEAKIPGATPEIELPSNAFLAQNFAGWRMDPLRLSDGPDWARRSIRLAEAWEETKSNGLAAYGEGVLIGHPDTGHAYHKELAGDPPTVLDLSWNTLTNRQPGEAKKRRFEQWTHGDATGSVIVSPLTHKVDGTAPKAKIIPYRSNRWVVVIPRMRGVAKAIYKAIEANADVISMSLGSLPSPLVRRALDKAVASGLIVVAAAGNQVRFVVYPASDPDCIGVAGSQQVDGHHFPWDGSCRGKAVDLTAPGHEVLCATHDNPTGYHASSGTSFSAAFVAGSAALWIAHFGRNRIEQVANSRGASVQELFRSALKQTARPFEHHWPDTENWGAGHLDTLELLKLAPESIDPSTIRRQSYGSSSSPLAALFDTSHDGYDPVSTPRDALLKLEDLWLDAVFAVGPADGTDVERLASPTYTANWQET